MALAIQRTSFAKGRLVSTFILVFAMMLQPLVGLNIPSAFAASQSVDVTISPNPISGEEYVEFTNNSASSVDLGGIHVTEMSGVNPTDYFTVDPDTVLASGQSYKVCVTGCDQTITLRNKINDNGDTLTFYVDSTKAKQLNVITTNDASGSRNKGTITTGSFVLEFVVAPTATITTPRHGGVVATTNRGNTLAVSGTFVDDKAVNYLQLELVRAGNLVTVHTMHSSNPGLNADGTFAISMPVPANLESGTYSLYYTATDFENGVSERKERTFFIDNTNPTPTLVAPTGLVGSTFTVYGEAVDNQNLSRVYVQLVNRQNSQRYGGTTIHLSGTSQPWSRVYDAIALNLPNGDYAAHVSVVDSVGNTANVGWSENFTVDRTMPTVAIKTGTGINDGSRGEYPHYRQISFKLNDSSGSLKEAVISNSLNGEKVYPRSGVWNDLNWLNVNKGHLMQGENTIIVRDSAGNESAPLAFTYDSVAPTATFSFSNNNGSALTNDDVTVTMTSSEPIQTPAGWAQVGVDGTQFTRVYTENGKHEVAISDRAGNVSEPQNFEVKRIDRNAPTISGITDGAIASGDVTLSIFDPKYQGYDGFDRLTGLEVNGVAVPTTESGGKTYLYTISEDGIYTVVATDKAGNASDEFIFTVDSTAPVANITSHSDGESVSGVVSLVGEVTDENPMNTYFVISDGTKSKKTNGDLIHELEWDTTSLPNGEYFVQFETRDRAGNKTSVSTKRIALIVDNPQPVVNGENFNTHSGNDYKGLNVGFNIANFTEVTGITVELHDANGAMVTNVHNQNLLNLINDDNITQLSTPFITVAGSYLEEYWDMNTNDYIWTAGSTRPTHAVVTVTGTNNAGETVTASTMLEDFSEPNGWTFASILPMPASAGIPRPVDQTTGQTPNPSPNINSNPNTNSNPGESPVVSQSAQIFTTPVALFGGQDVFANQATPETTTEDSTESTSDSDVLGESDQDSETTLSDTGEVLGLMDNKLFGLISYKWLAILAALVAGWLVLAATIRRRRAEEM